MAQASPETLSRVVELIRIAMPGSDDSELSRDADLYERGLDSSAAISLMLAVEERFSVAFPDYLLDDATFRTPGSLADAVQGLLA